MSADQLVEDNEEFDLEKLLQDDDDPMLSKVVTTVYGAKGSGKTTFVLQSALYLPRDHVILAISFDGQTMPIKQALSRQHGNQVGNRIIVKSGVADYPRVTPKDWQVKSFESVKKVLGLLKKVSQLPEKKRPYIVLLDGMEILSKMCEQVMRYKYGLDAFSGFGERTRWHYRTFLMDAVHDHALQATRRHLVYTTYPTIVDKTTKNGEVIDREESPRWLGNMEKKTDTVIRTDRVTIAPTINVSQSRQAQSNQDVAMISRAVFYATIDSSKRFPEYTGKRFNVTGKSFLHLFDKQWTKESELVEE